ncbi:MAG: hypothetical protein ACI97A_002103 [Planctomycetota bacterium]|jgi:hypothetical protein
MAFIMRSMGYDTHTAFLAHQKKMELGTFAGPKRAENTGLRLSEESVFLFRELTHQNRGVGTFGQEEG